MFFLLNLSLAIAHYLWLSRCITLAISIYLSQFQFISLPLWLTPFSSKLNALRLHGSRTLTYDTGVDWSDWQNRLQMSICIHSALVVVTLDFPRQSNSICIQFLLMRTINSMLCTFAIVGLLTVFVDFATRIWQQAIIDLSRSIELTTLHISFTELL